ncbi:hypothetical protein E5S67_06353 [Microcoleus sp. IPMA8]|uniref:Uncharacterized protein n=1 Tax=Microcoleus asticus IPMA8 TaxID=2563858 RepID=A0ABX2D8T5_9CYAN|nr:hypothetical protein [Microcoleus asticus IPMA8]
MRGLMEKQVVEESSQPEKTRNVTSRGAESPQKGRAATIRLENGLAAISGVIGDRITIQETPIKVRGIKPVEILKNRSVSPGRRLSATNEAAVSQA